jgi:hypothetical protein
VEFGACPARNNLKAREGRFLLKEPLQRLQFVQVKFALRQDPLQCSASLADMGDRSELDHTERLVVNGAREVAHCPAVHTGATKVTILAANEGVAREKRSNCASVLLGIQATCSDGAAKDAQGKVASGHLGDFPCFQHSEFQPIPFGSQCRSLGVGK